MIFTDGGRIVDLVENARELDGEIRRAVASARTISRVGHIFFHQNK